MSGSGCAWLAALRMDDCRRYAFGVGFADSSIRNPPCYLNGESTLPTGSIRMAGYWKERRVTPGQKLPLLWGSFPVPSLPTETLRPNLGARRRPAEVGRREYLGRLELEKLSRPRASGWPSNGDRRGRVLGEKWCLTLLGLQTRSD